jgi:hypothetical protein
MPDELLGNVVLTLYECDPKRYICGIFGQLKYGYDGVCYTNYDAVRCALAKVKTVADKNDDRSYRFAVPYKMSCGLAGGDWNIIHKILEELFGKADNIMLEVWRLSV